MSVEIRAAKPEDMTRFGEIDQIAFARSEPTGAARIPADWTICAFQDGEMATTHAAIPYTMRFNGNKIAVAGVTAVASLPWFRRLGHLRQIMAHEFGRWHEQGAPSLAILYASMAAIYQRFGYAVVSKRLLYRLDRREIRWAFPLEVGGQIRAAGKDEIELLDGLYRKFTAQRTGPLHRSPAHWERTNLASGIAARGPILAVIYEEDHRPLGYMLYSVSDDPHRGPGPNQTVHLSELVWQTPAAYRGLWEYLGRIDLAKEVRAMPVAPDDALFELLLEPRLLAPAIYDGLLARIIDVDRVLPARGYAEPATLTFRVVDALCPWNAQTWQLETSTDGAGIRATSQSPQITLPVDTLAKLVFGYLTASQAERMGRLDAHDYAALRLWDTVMRTDYAAFCMDHF